MITRKNTEFAKRIFFDRLGDDYIYGGTFDPFNIKAGADCSGLVTDELGALFFGTAMHWDREGLSTESYRYKPLGPQKIGPFDLVHVASLSDIPADAAAVINLHHEGDGGPHSHMNIRLDGIYMEESGSYGCCTDGKAIPSENSYWNDHWYVPGPIVEDGTPRVPEAPAPGVISVEPKDTLFADVSEFQTVVNDQYPYQVLSIRSNDGTYRDHNFAANYAWMRKALDDGRLKAGIVYFYWRPNWQDAIATHKDMINSNGGLHPKIAVMIDVERGGNPAGDFSDALNATDDALVQWIGDPKRVIAYGNTGDLNSMWSNRREDQFIVAGYGSNPSFPGKIAHQYTDGQGYGGGLPEGAPPFGNCDMNSADGYTPTAFAAALGITAPQPTNNPPGNTVPTKPTDTAQQVSELYDQARLKWEMLGWRSEVEALAAILDHLLGTNNAGKTGARFDG